MVRTDEGLFCDPNNPGATSNDIFFNQPIIWCYDSAGNPVMVDNPEYSYSAIYGQQTRLLSGVASLTDNGRQKLYDIFQRIRNSGNPNPHVWEILNEPNYCLVEQWNGWAMTSLAYAFTWKTLTDYIRQLYYQHWPQKTPLFLTGSVAQQDPRGTWTADNVTTPGDSPPIEFHVPDARYINAFISNHIWAQWGPPALDGFGVHLYGFFSGNVAGDITVFLDRLQRGVSILRNPAYKSGQYYPTHPIGVTEFGYFGRPPLSAFQGFMTGVWQGIKDRNIAVNNVAWWPSGPHADFPEGNLFIEDTRCALTNCGPTYRDLA